MACAVLTCAVTLSCGTPGGAAAVWLAMRESSVDLSSLREAPGPACGLLQVRRQQRWRQQQRWWQVGTVS